MFKLDLEKEEEPEIKLLTSIQHRKSKRLPEKHLLLLHLLCQSLWLCGSQQTVENSSRNGNTRPPDCLLRNLCAGQKATVGTGHGTMDWFQIGKAVLQGCILSPCLFNLLQRTSCKMLNCMNHKLYTLWTHELSIEFSRPEYWSG